MKDITAILLYYSEHSALYKALQSLNRIQHRVKSIIVFQSKDEFMHENESVNHMPFFRFDGSLHELIYIVKTPYVLFLHQTDYLCTELTSDELQLSRSKKVLTTFCYYKAGVIRRPLLISMTFLKRKHFLSEEQLPFKEALFPAWLATVDESVIQHKDGLVKQSKKQTTPTIVEKNTFTQKYQLEKMQTTYPTISVILANYNMEKYVETAITSCLLQNERAEQLLLIDDGSTDDSYRRMRRFHDGNEVHVFRKKNEGKAKALNELLPYVTSDFILELDADDWLDPDAISTIKKLLATLPVTTSLLYGNLRNWKQGTDDVIYKGVSQGVRVHGTNDLLSYRFPLGPRIYRTATLKKEGGFPIISFEGGRLYEDVSLLFRLIKKYPFCYRNFTVYNVREHNASITKQHGEKWGQFLKTITE